ncbi:MFS transporter [Arcanobacterium haemolyticum]|nr:MFS transporter [Arcanobacterium haemolyticum]
MATNNAEAAPLAATISPTSSASTPGSPTESSSTSGTARRRGFITGPVLAWSMWDWGSAAFNAVVTTFVFSVYLTNEKLFGASANTNLGWALAIAGVAVALVAPAIGAWTDRTGKRHTVLTVTTIGVVVTMALLFLVKPGESFLWLGLVLLALGNVLFETGSVVYNAMVNDVSTPDTVGRVSGFGWGMGYVGGIVLLLVLYVGFIAPDPAWFGISHDEGLNIRISMLICAAWMLASSLPLLIKGRDLPAQDSDVRGIFGAYREIIRSIARLWRTDRSVVWFLISSAIYRDGLAGVFTFGGVLAAAAFGFSSSDVLMFGVAANLVAGIATIGFGRIDDKFGSRTLIILSLSLMTAAGLLVFALHSGIGALSPSLVFWIFGLILCVFVGPTQSASRTYLARIAPRGNEGEIFGLYATTGRAVSFLAPTAYSLAITLAAGATGASKADVAHYGILGIAVVLLVGLVAFLPVKAQAK